MKKTARKLLSVLLSFIMIFSLTSVAFAKEDVTPVIVVSGMNSFPLTSGKTGEVVWPIQTDNIMSAVKESVLPAAAMLVTGNREKYGGEIINNVYTKIFEKVACNENGESVYDVDITFFSDSLDKYPDEFGEGATVSEGGITRSLIREIGRENVYYFNYDWRLSPMKHADELNKLVEKAKADKGVSKVTLIPCSMGGTVTNAYLYKYGSDSVKKIIYTMSAIQGLSSVGEMFSRRIDFNVDTLMNYLFSMQKDDLKMQVVMAIVNTLVETMPCVTKLADKLTQEVLAQTNDRVYNELMIKSMGKFAGWWAMVPDEYYDNAKEAFFEGNIPESFEKLIDSYHYNVQRNAEDLMKSAADKGVDIYVLASYGYVGAPYTNQAMTQTDCLIETHYQSGRALTAPYGETFGKDYIAKGTQCSDLSHNHVSTDGIIDASTCFFPENTWFIKYNKHVGVPYGTDCEKLMLYLALSDDYVTVRSNEKYPQFMELNRLTGELTSLTGDEIKIDLRDKESSFIIRMIIICDTIIKNIKTKLPF